MVLLFTIQDATPTGPQGQMVSLPLIDQSPDNKGRFPALPWYSDDANSLASFSKCEEKAKISFGDAPRSIAFTHLIDPATEVVKLDPSGKPIPLVHVEDHKQFYLWLAAKNKNSGQVRYLKHVIWHWDVSANVRLDHNGKFKLKFDEDQAVNDLSIITVGDGAGPSTPIMSGLHPLDALNISVCTPQ